MADMEDRIDAAMGAWPPPVDLPALARREPSPPAMIIDDWLPAGYASLIAGHGGIGKSSITLHLAACIALGRPWWGLPTLSRRVLYLSCEDRESVLHWRLERLCRHIGISMADLDGRLDLRDLVGRDTMLYTDGPTRAYDALRDHMRGIDVLVIDGISDTFGGNENARADVKRFVNHLVALIPPDTGAVLLVGHVSKPAVGGAAEGYSGSTGWHNSVRARWYLYPEVGQDDDGESEKTGDLLLELQKSNLGRTDQSIRFRWDEAAHMYLGHRVAGKSRQDQGIRDATERDWIVWAIGEIIAEGGYCPAAIQGPRTAVSVLTARPDCPKSLQGKGNRKRFLRHIEHLRQIRRITTGKYRRENRHIVETLEVSSPVTVGVCVDAPNCEKENTTQSDARRQCADAPHSAGGYKGGARAHTPSGDPDGIVI